MRGDSGDESADHERRDHGAYGDDRRAVGQLGAEDTEQRLEADGHADTRCQADDRAQEADDDCLEDDGAVHLAAAGPESAHQGELTSALCDQHRERVEDDEGTDEQCDRREDQQERVEEAEALLHVTRLLLGKGGSGDCLGLVGQHGGDAFA